MSTKLNYEKLETEKRNAGSIHLDQLSISEAAALMNQMDAEIPSAVQKALPEIVQTIEMAADAFKNGGRIIYVGAGTSGRLGVLDASESVPTFGVSPDMIIGKIAGGDKALRTAIEGAEDDAALGEEEMRLLNVCEKDLVIAISASGSAAYCQGALQYARKQGAQTAGVTCVAEPAFADDCDCLIKAVVGPEILTGSTRLRAGTATKMILNMISTLSMVQIGKVYQNYMVDVVPTNRKLLDRSIRIVMNACGMEREAAGLLLEKCDGEIKTAIICHETGADAAKAREALQKTEGSVRQAIAECSLQDNEQGIMQTV